MATKTAGVVGIRPFDDLVEEYFQIHPEEVDEYIHQIFDEYAQDGDLQALLASLRVMSRVKGVTQIATETGMSRRGVQKILSGKGNPEFTSILAILHSMGYRLIPEKIC